MAEKSESSECSGNTGDFFDYLADSFWASLPEETATSLAQCKKDSLAWIRDTVTCLVDGEIKRTDEHLKNAQRMRQSYRESQGPATDNPQPV